MQLAQPATDWEVAIIAQLEVGIILDGGFWMVSFRSAQAGGSELFFYSGLGIGVGGELGSGVSMPDLRTMKPAYTSLKCDRAFSAHDLDGSGGRLTTAGASLVVGGSLAYVSAFNMRGSLFASQPCHGGALGVGAGLGTTIGTWRSETMSTARSRRHIQREFRPHRPASGS